MEKFQINNIDSSPYVDQTYKEDDINLLSPININKEFGENNDIIEMHIISPNGDILISNYNFTDYKKVNNINNSSLFDTILLYPEKDLTSYGYNVGQFDIIYNFNRLLFNSSNNSKFFIKEISRDRTEIKITSNDISYLELQSLFIEYITNKNQRNFYSDFVLNFGGNKTIIGVNIALDTNINIPSLFIKLYEPLSNEYVLKNTLWIEEVISEPYTFRLNNNIIIEESNNLFPLRGPNFDIEINKQISTPTTYLNISNILTNDITSSYNQLQSLIGESTTINIDYNSLPNFIHFSSAKERIENFIYKLTQIQNLEKDLNILSNISSSVDTGSINNSILLINNQISNITKNFDGYEYFLYYESGSNSFPKINNTRPYINDNVTSSISLIWIGSNDEQSNYYGGKILEHFNYDIQNRDYIWNNLPEYIKYDSQNSQLELMVSMMGQHYDYIWTYIKDITNKNINDNRLDYGISKDLVGETLKSFGLKLYTNSRNNENIYLSLLGENPDGTFLPSTGLYNIDNYVTASNYTIPNDNIVKETYKRIYNNLPYLLKSKGTQKGIRALINCFGIPDTILNIKEFGGVIKDQDFIEQNTNKFNYSLSGEGDNILYIPWSLSNQRFIESGSDVLPDGIEFRFKNNISTILSNPTQSILEINPNNIFITSTHISGTYGILEFSMLGYPSSSVISSSLILPLYNDNWWSVYINRDNPGNINSSSNTTYTLYVGEKSNTNILTLESCSIYVDGSTQSDYNLSWNTSGSINFGTSNNKFLGDIQEFRYWIDTIPLEDFQDHILNPKSFSNTNETSSYRNLIFRIPLGSELDNIKDENIYSVHPSPINSFINIGITSSYAINTNFNDTIYNFNYEKYLINTPNGGNFIESNEKIKIIETKTLADNVLSPGVSIIKKPLYNQVKNSSNIEIGISPQNSINDDIIKQLGNFNIDNYIGDPKDSNKTSYNDLNKLRNFYFKKYNNSQSIKDSIKLLSYFDNSLFKMIKDFTPAKSNISSGLIIKPTLLEKNKIQKFEPILENKYLETIIETAYIEGTNSLNTDLYINNNEVFPSIVGYVVKKGTNQKEWFNGEISGSNIIAHSQSKENIIYENNKINPNNSINDDYNRIILNPLLNNIQDSRKSKKYLNVDYNSNVNIPSNINYITSSLIDGNENSILFSDIQESNYSLKRHIYPRYNGSKTKSKLYNNYSIGDSSYGKTAAIDYENIKFAYFQEITSQSKTLPERVNVNIKYIIDENSNITELTRQNKNIFDVQNIFNKNNADIILDDNKNPSNQQKLDGLKGIFSGGFRYEPILQNIKGTHKYLEYTYENDFQTPNSGGLGNVIESLDNDSLIIGTPFLNNPITYDQLNTFSNNNRGVGLNSSISIPVQRNTGDNREIIQRISGSFELISYISPPTNLVTKLYSLSNYQGSTYNIHGAIYAGWVNTYSDSFVNLAGTDGNILSVNVPAGISLDIWGDDYRNGVHRNIIGPSSISLGGCPLCNGMDGLTSLETKILDCFVSANIYSTYNSFSKPTKNELLILNDTTYTTSVIGNSIPSTQIEKNNEIGIKITFNIDGYIVLPQGQNSANLILQDLTFNTGILRSDITFNNIAPNNSIQFTTAPILNSNINKFESPFILGSPPQFLYITGTLDNGFDSGSEDNYYFERGTYSGSNIYSLLTASYDLSTIYFEQKLRGNDFLQTFPPFSHRGYEDIDGFFNIKVGDLCRFYNHNKEEFPVNYEREVVKIFPPLNPPSPNFIDDTNRLFILLDDSISDQSCSDNGITIPTNIQNFIFLSKIPDETNVIINTSKRDGKTSPGLILPENISKSLKSKAGNIIKTLKNQNLI